MATVSPNARAWLDTIRFAEGTAGENGYGTMFGGGSFDWSKGHPDRVVNSGGYSSAAAGAYQFMPGTWKAAAGALGLKDFSPASQDQAALWLMRRRGVDPDQPLSVATLEKLAPEWASLPTRSGKSYYGQPVKGLKELEQVYSASLGRSGVADQTAPQQITDALKEILEPPRQPSGDPLTAMATLGANRFALSPEFTQEMQALDPSILAVQALFGRPPSALATGPATEQIATARRVDDQPTLQPIEYLTGDKSHQGYDAAHGGGNYHEHLAFATTAQRDAAMQKLKAAGIQIGSVNDGKHAPGSYHYQDLAFDVPAAQVPVGQEQALSKRVRSILGIA